MCSSDLNPEKTINESATVSDWVRMSSATSPYVFKENTDENMNAIITLLKNNKHAMFLRKVDKQFPDDSIKYLMNLKFNHSYKKSSTNNFTTFINCVMLIFAFTAVIIIYNNSK